MVDSTAQEKKEDFVSLASAFEHLKKGNLNEAFKHFTRTKEVTHPKSKENLIAHKFAHEIAHKLEKPHLEGLGVKEFLEMVEHLRINPANKKLANNIVLLSKKLEVNDQVLAEKNFRLIKEGEFKGNEKDILGKNIILTNSPKFTSNYALEKCGEVIVCGGVFEGSSALFEVKKVTVLDGKFNGEFALTSAENVVIVGGVFERMALFKVKNCLIFDGLFKDRGTLLESDGNIVLGGEFPGDLKFPKMSNSRVFLPNTNIRDIKNPGLNNLFIIKNIGRIKFEDPNTIHFNEFYSTNKPDIVVPENLSVRWKQISEENFKSVKQELKIVTPQNLDRAIKIIESGALEKVEYLEL